MTHHKLRHAPEAGRLAGLAVIAGAALCTFASTAARAQFGPPPVRVAPVSFEHLAPTVTVPGTVRSRDEAQLAAETAGAIVDIAEIGTMLERGQAVARIDDDILQLQRSEFESIVARERSRLGFLEREVQRLSALAQRNNAARSQLDQTESDLAVANNELGIAQSRLGQIQAQLDRAVVKAPFGGQVTERFVNVGEHVSMGDEIARIMSRDRLEVVSRAPLQTVRFLDVGSQLEIEGDAGSGSGVVRTIVPYGGNSSANMYELRIDVPASEWAIAETVRMAIPLRSPERVLAVPRDALVLRRGGAAVYRVTAEGTAQRVAVTTGFGARGLIAVEGDLAAGDQVVVRGAERLQPGQQVAVIADEPPAANPQGEASAAH